MYEPIEYEGVKTMSFGFAASKQAAILRGPLVSKIIS